MTAIVPNIEPRDCVAGDSLTWTFNHPDYPKNASPAWVLSYGIVGAGAVTWNTAWVAADPSNPAGFLVTIPTTATAGLAAGSYSLTRFVTDGTTRKSWELPPLNIEPNAATALAGSTRTAKLEADLAAALAARSARLLGDDPEEYTIGGRSVKKVTLETLNSMISTLQWALWRARNPGVVRQHRVIFGEQVT